jgi:hypothetical protein
MYGYGELQQRVFRQRGGVPPSVSALLFFLLSTLPELPVLGGQRLHEHLDLYRVRWKAPDLHAAVLLGRDLRRLRQYAPHLCEVSIPPDLVRSLD